MVLSTGWLVMTSHITVDTPDKSERAVFNLLWDMYNEIEANSQAGTIIGRYASIIDDRIKNSGHSRSVTSLKLYTTEQLEEELESRDD